MKYLSRPLFNESDVKLFENQLEKEEKDKVQMEKINAVRANKNKMRDRLMSEHLDILRDHRKWE
jgi:hypothetical protein